jgi:hypothetical protein
MTVIAQSADGVQHQFPDGTDPSVIDKVMKSYAQQNAPANPAVDVARSIPGGLAKGAAAIIGLPGDLSNLANRGMDYLTGGNVAQRNPAVVSSDTVNKLLSGPTGGYYQPKTTAGKYAETIASFAPAALAPGGTAARIGRAVLPGAASESAGQATQGTSLEPYARAAGAMIGGAVPSIVKLGARPLNAAAVVTTGKGFLDPTKEAKAQIAAAVAKDGPVSIAQNTARYSQAGASTPALVDVAGNNVKRLVRAAASSEGPGQNMALDYADTVRGNYQDRLLGHTRNLTPDTRTTEQLAADLKKSQRDQANTLYRQPYSQPVTMTPDALRALRGPDGQAAIDDAILGARANQRLDQVNELLSLKTADLDHPPTVSGGTLDSIRIAMGERGGAAARNGSNVVAAGLFGRKAGLDTALDATPGLKEARQAYRQNQAQRDAVDVGKRAYNTPSQDYSAALARLSTVSQQARQAAGVGHAEALINAIERGPEGSTGAANRIATSTQQTSNLGETFGQPKAARYQDAVRLETQRLRNANFVSPNTGSQTQLRASDANFLNAIPLSRQQLVGLMMDKLRSGLTMTPAERTEIVRMGISEARLQVIAKRAPSRLIQAMKTAATNTILSQANP